MNIKKTLFKKDPEALLMKLIKSTTIPKPEKEKVILALTNTPQSSNQIISIIEKSLGHTVIEIVPFLSKPAASSSSAQSDTKQTAKNVIKDSTTKQKSPNHDTDKKSGHIKWWRGRNKTLLVNQLEKRGIRLTKEQVKGGIDENGETIKNDKS